MLIKRSNLESLMKILTKLSSQQFSIQTQYKFLKLDQPLCAEWEIYQKQRAGLQQFFEKDENGNPIVLPDGGIKVDMNRYDELQQAIEDIESIEIQVPDIYFSLDELSNLGLTLGELAVLEPFIKE